MPFTLPDDFPNWARAVAYAIVAIGLGVTFLVSKLGARQGSAAPASPAGSAQVAAIIVDPSALNHATAAVEALNMTLLETNKVGRAMARGSAASALAVKALADKVEALREEVDRLREEIIRKGG